MAAMTDTGSTAAPALADAGTTAAPATADAATAAAAPVVLYTKASRDGTKPGDCPFTHYAMMALALADPDG